MGKMLLQFLSFQIIHVLWGEDGEYVDVGKTWGKMLIQFFSLISFQTTHPLWGGCGEYVDVGKTWGKC